MHNWSDEEIEILRRDYGNTLVQEIPIDRSVRSIYLKAHRLGLKGEVGPKPIYSYDESAFDSDYATYWAGFIAADGNISVNMRVLQLDLVHKDRDHLKKFKDFINYSGPIYDYSKSCKLTINNAKSITERLAAFGVRPRKTFAIQPPAYLSDDAALHFIRGYFDGDGWFTESKSHGKYKYPVIGFCGTLGMMEWVYQSISDKVNLKRSHSIHPHNNIYQFTITGSSVLDICEWLYSNSNEDVRLTRKYKVYRNWLA